MNKPSASLVISLIALFISLGGTSYAVTALDDNSVTTPKIRDGAVTSAKLADNSVTASKIPITSIPASKLLLGSIGTFQIGNKSILGDDLADNSVDSAKVKDGSITATDLAAGAAAPPVLSLVARPTESRIPIRSSYLERSAVKLPAGKWLVTADLDVVGPPSRNDNWLILQQWFACSLANVNPDEAGARPGSVFDTIRATPNGETRWSLRAAIDVPSSTSINARVGIWCGAFSPPTGSEMNASIWEVRWHALKVSSIASLSQ